MTDPLWLSVARMCVGIAEVPGAQSNPAILQWARDIGAPSFFNNDDVPWCAIVPNRVFLALGMPMSGTGYDLLRAKSFATWGQPLAAPALGAVLVFARPEGAHVGFYVGERADAYYVLGGNQSNAVTYTWIAKSRLVAMRWPGGVALPIATPILLASDGTPLSTNEA